MTNAAFRRDRAKEALASVAKLEAALADNPTDRGVAINLASMRRHASALLADVGIATANRWLSEIDGADDELAFAAISCAVSTWISSAPPEQRSGMLERLNSAVTEIVDVRERHKRAKEGTRS